VCRNNNENNSLKSIVLKRSHLVFTTLSQCGSHLLTDVAPKDIAFKVVVVDEAAQAVEPSAVIPLRLDVFAWLKWILKKSVNNHFFWFRSTQTVLGASDAFLLATQTRYSIKIFLSVQKCTLTNESAFCDCKIG